MARIRTVKPTFWTDEKIVELSPWARLLFIGTWNFADDEGRMEYSPKRLKMQVFPADSVELVELSAELVEHGLVRIYKVDGKEYLQIINFDKHQKIDRRTNSKFPPFPPSPAESPRVSQSHPEQAASLAELPRTPPTEGKGMERKENNSPPSAEFSRFWDSWPNGERKQSRGKCRDVWLRKRFDSEAATIIAHVEKMKQSEGWRTGYDPAPLTYLNQRRWEGAGEPPEPTGEVI